MERVTRGQPPERLVLAFEQGFSALWQRAHRTLGEVTLTAILDRVLFNAAEHFPILSSLRVEATGLRCQELRDTAGSVHSDQLSTGIRYVLVEFLTVLGDLTANVLDSAMHEALSRSAGDPPDLQSKAGERAKS